MAFCLFFCINTFAEAKNELKAPNVTVKVGAYNKLVVEWNAVKGAEKYLVYRSDAQDGEYERIGVVSAKKTEYVDNVVRCGVTYYYKVSAKNGEKSEVVSGRTRPKKIQFTNECKTYKAKQVLKWQASKGAKGYEIYRAKTGSDNYQLVKNVTGKTTTRWVDKTVGPSV